MGRITGDTLKNLVEKYKFALIVVLLGVLFLLWPSSSASKAAVDPPPELSTPTDIPGELGRVLSLVEGAGEVEVYLTVARGSETLYQTDESSPVGDSGTAQRQTVILSGESRNESGLVRQILPETYLGAIVVCPGADDPAVRLALTQAVSRATGLGADKISVLKRK